ncbi:MAG: DnaA ATPase domain-containing protein [Planctomycetota bacterium]
MAAARKADANPIPQLRQALRRRLPPPLAEVLLPAVQWRCSAKRVTAVVPNHIWEDLFETHARPVAEEWLAARKRLLITVSRQELVAQHYSREQTFDNFLQDPGNEFALSACRQVLDAPGLAHNPLYLHGPPGCGKSHLLRALAHEFSAMLDNRQVLVIDGPSWVSHLAQELAERGPSPLRDEIEAAVLIVFDDVNALGDRPLAQEQLFHLINNAMEDGRQLALAGRNPPRHLPAIEDRLVTRLAWGLAVPIDPPHLETRLAHLRQLAPVITHEQEPTELTRMVEAFAPDMHHVARLAERLLEGDQITQANDAASFDSVLAHVAQHYAVRPGDIAGKRRHRPVALARQLALLLGRRLTGHSLQALGGMVGGRDHTTVLYNIRQAENRIAADPDYAREVDELAQQILSSDSVQRPGFAAP